MSKLVSISLPIYKRLEYLPHVLKILDSQDYPSIELIVSDNGVNGEKLRGIVEAHYSRPFKFRRNPATVPMGQHFNQILEAASGEYYLLLADDDEISLNFVSELVEQLERCPQASIAFGRQEIIDRRGILLRESSEDLPPLLSGLEFIPALWRTYQFKLESVSTFLARTKPVKALGGYPVFTGGNHMDNGLLIRLCLNSHVALNSKCVFRVRVDESAGYGWSVSVWEIAAATNEFLRFLDTDVTIREFAAAQPVQWQELRACIVRMAWETYLGRWNTIYRHRLPPMQWARAAFALPFITDYYKAAASILVAAARQALGEQARRLGRRRTRTGE